MGNLTSTLIPTDAKSILLKRNYADDWFLDKYATNIYRGCQHACEYCDGRSQRYYLDLDISNKIYIKINAPDLVRKEPRNKEKGIVAVGGDKVIIEGKIIKEDLRHWGRPDYLIQVDHYYNESIQSGALLT